MLSCTTHFTSIPAQLLPAHLLNTDTIISINIIMLATFTPITIIIIILFFDSSYPYHHSFVHAWFSVFFTSNECFDASRNTTFIESFLKHCWKSLTPSRAQTQLLLESLLLEQLFIFTPRVPVAGVVLHHLDLIPATVALHLLGAVPSPRSRALLRILELLLGQPLLVHAAPAQLVLRHHLADNH